MTKAPIIEGYEECSHQEFMSSKLRYGNIESQLTIYYKKKQEFPIVFEKNDRRIEVDKTGVIDISSTEEMDDCKCWCESLSILKQAIAASDKIRGKINETS